MPVSAPLAAWGRDPVVTGGGRRKYAGPLAWRLICRLWSPPMARRSAEVLDVSRRIFTLENEIVEKTQLLRELHDRLDALVPDDASARKPAAAKLAAAKPNEG